MVWGFSIDENATYSTKRDGNSFAKFETKLHRVGLSASACWLCITAYRRALLANNFKCDDNFTIAAHFIYKK